MKNLARIGKEIGRWAMVVAVAALAADAGAMEGQRAPQDPTRSELIVKYKAGQGPALETKGPGVNAAAASSLQSLNRRFKVRRARKLFADEASAAPLGARSVAPNRVEEIKRRFPRRSRRIPAGAKMPDLSAVYVLELESAADVPEAAKAFSADPNVAYAEPNQTYAIQLEVNDPFYGSSGTWGNSYDDLWGIKRVRSAPGWDVNAGDGIVVAVVDTGVDLRHPDLQPNLWVNPGEIPGNNIDDDANGCRDDIHGCDFSGVTQGGAPEDRHGHGTHVAGTIAAVGNNGAGVVGVAWRSRIMAVRAFDAQGFAGVAGIAAGLRYAVDNGADVINNSWGGVGESFLIRDAIAYAHAMGAVIVAAAGNNGLDITLVPFFPAVLENVIAVSAFDPFDQPAWFTNYGSRIDIAAPGVDVLSLLARFASGVPPGKTVGQYVRLNGTSMAAPHVSGAAALVLSRFPHYSSHQVRQALRSTAQPLSPATHAGQGMLDVAAAVQAAEIPELLITSPRRLSTVQGTVPIRGTAAGRSFARYRVSYASAAEPDRFTLIAGPLTTPVTDGILAQWNTSGLPFGDYLLRLTVTDTTGKDFTVDQFPVAVRPWRAEPVREAFEGLHVSLAYDSTGGPHVTYHGLSPSTLIYAKRTAAGWTSEEIDRSQAPNRTTGWGNSLALDSKDQPVISYTANLTEIRVAARRSGQWVRDVVDRNNYSLNGVFTSLAIDALDGYHLSYHYGNFTAGTAELRYAYRAPDGDWRRETVFPEDASFESSLALDPAGRPLIAFTTGNRLRLARRDGDAWTTELVATAAQGNVYAPSLVVDAAGRPRIAYTEFAGFDYVLRYAEWNGASWTIETVAPVSGAANRFGSARPSLAMDPLDRPSIAFADAEFDAGARTHQTHFARKDAGVWTVEPIELGSAPSLKIDPAGLPAAAYFTADYFEIIGVPTGNDVHLAVRQRIPAPADSQPPTLSITSPVNGAALVNQVTIAGTAVDSGGLHKIEMQINAGPVVRLSGASPFSTTLTSDKFIRGENRVTVQAVDRSGNVTRRSVRFTVKTATHVPEGSLDCFFPSHVAIGRAVDRDDLTAKTTVHFYVDGPAGQGVFAGSIRADRHLQQPGHPDAHSFEFPIPARFIDGKPHALYAYALDIGGNNHQLLSGSPKTFQSPSLPIGAFESISSSGVATGWAADLDVPTQPLAIHFYLDGPAGFGGTIIGGAETSVIRPDRPLTPWIPARGFEFPIPRQYRDGRPHVLYAYALDGNTPGNTLLPGSALSFQIQPTAPIGAVNGVSGSTVYGWSYDGDGPADAVEIHIYIDGPAGVGRIAGGAVANLARSDVNASAGIPGNHGFRFTIPAQYRDGRNHTLYAYAIDVERRVNPLLAGSGVVFNSAQVWPLGGVTGLSDGNRVEGWAADLDAPTQALAVHFYVGGPAGVGQFAGAAVGNQASAVAAEALGVPGNHGFAWTIPKTYWDGRPHQVYAYAINIGPPALNPLLDRSPLAFTVRTVAPAGSLDGFTEAGDAVGWAADPGLPREAAQVHFYIDGPAGFGGQIIGGATADQPDANANAAGIAGNHGYRFRIPSTYWDGRDHTLYAYGINLNGASPNSLLEAPRVFRLSSTGRLLASGEAGDQGLAASAAGPDETFALREAFAYPNPAVKRGQITFRADLGLADDVEFRVYNDLGEKVAAARATQAIVKEGRWVYEVPFSVSDLASGTYLYIMEAKKKDAAPLRSTGKFAVVR